MKRTFIMPLLAACFAFQHSSSGAEMPGLRWERRKESVSLSRNGQVLWRFNFGPSHPKPFFHPIALPGGPVLTADRPTDHPWHHGLWFSWKYINGVNYWEPTSGSELSEGRTEWRDVQIDYRDDSSARIAMNVEYRPSGGAAVLTEKRIIEISPPDAQGMFQLDWTMTFTSVEADVVLSRTPVPGEPGGQPWGGYAGLSVRLAKDLSNARITIPSGLAELTKGFYRGKALAMDYSGRFEQREAGIAIFDHSQNLNTPTPWYAANDGTMCYFSPAVLFFQPHKIKAKEQLRLRYRVVVHPGRWEASDLTREIDRYTNSEPQ